MANRLSSANREWTTDHVHEIGARWEPRPVSEARGDVTFLVREIERLWDDLQDREDERDRYRTLLRRALVYLPDNSAIDGDVKAALRAGKDES